MTKYAKPEITPKKPIVSYPCYIDLVDILSGNSIVIVMSMAGTITGGTLFLYFKDKSVPKREDIKINIAVTNDKGVEGVTHTKVLKAGTNKLDKDIDVKKGDVISFSSNIDIVASLTITYNLRVRT